MFNTQKINQHQAVARNPLERTEGAENDRPPIRPAERAAKASPGADSATAATAAATVKCLAKSAVKTSHALFFLPSSPSAAVIRNDDAAGIRWRVGAVAANVALVEPAVKRARGAGGKKADAGAHAVANKQTDAVLMVAECAGNRVLSASP